MKVPKSLKSSPRRGKNAQPGHADDWSIVFLSKVLSPWQPPSSTTTTTTCMHLKRH